MRYVRRSCAVLPAMKPSKAAVRCAGDAARAPCCALYRGVVRPSLQACVRVVASLAGGEGFFGGGTTAGRLVERAVCGRAAAGFGAV